MRTPKESSNNNTALSQIYLRSGTASAAKLPSRIALSLNPMDTIELSSETIPQLMQQSNSEALEKVSDTDTIGITHRRYKQHYEGIEVIGAELLEHTNSKGEVFFIHGKMLETDSLSVKPEITESEALTSFKKIHESESPDVDEDNIRLVIKDALLCYEVLYSLPESNRNRYCLSYIDAVTASEIDNIIHQLEMNDEPVDYFTEPTNASGYLLSRERTSNSKVTFPALLGYWGITGSGGYCYDVIEGTEDYHFQNTRTIPSQIYKRFIIKVNDNGWEDTLYNWFCDYEDVGETVTMTEADLNNPDISSSAVSAAYNITKVMEYTHNVLGRNSFNDDYSLEGYGLEASSIAVLFIDGSIGTQYIYPSYGHAGYPFYAFYFDGPVEDKHKSKTVLDVVAHEFCHAVTYFTSRLSYANNSESQALNESYSDIFSAIVENYNQPDGTYVYPSVLPGHFDWYIGEDSTLDRIATRDLRDPSSLYTEDGIEGCKYYNDEVWNTTVNNTSLFDYYSRAGVQNHAFYLLSEGGSGYSGQDDDNLSYYSVNGIGVQYAGWLAMNALMYYLSSDATFQDSANAWLYALISQYEEGGISYDTLFAVGNSINHAWRAVGVQHSVYYGSGGQLFFN